MATCDRAPTPRRKVPTSADEAVDCGGDCRRELNERNVDSSGKRIVPRAFDTVYVDCRGGLGGSRLTTRNAAAGGLIEAVVGTPSRQRRSSCEY
jgi:hypothetical protein